MIRMLLAWDAVHVVYALRYALRYARLDYIAPVGASPSPNDDPPDYVNFAVRGAHHRDVLPGGPTSEQAARKTPGTHPPTRLLS